MEIKQKRKIYKLISFILVLTLLVPLRAFGAVKPIEEMEDKLEGITAKEKEVLEKLFSISQEIEATKQEQGIINREIEALQLQMKELEAIIENKQEEYNTQLELLEKVLVNYQRGGPASYLEILLKAEDLVSFLKRINVIRDLSRNVGDLLQDLKEGKKVLETEKDILREKAMQLEQKKAELQENIHKNELLKQKQEGYLASLQEERVFYQEQLTNLETMWADSRELFANIAKEITDIIGDGNFTMQDLNLNFGFTKMQGAIEEDTFNQILSENSKLPTTVFRYEADKVSIEVPEKHLVLTGNFVIAGDSAIRYEITAGTFYDIPLETASIEELFANGPLLIDFKTIAGDMVIIDFTLLQVQSQEGRLAFEIRPKW